MAYATGRKVPLILVSDVCIGALFKVRAVDSSFDDAKSRTKGGNARTEYSGAWQQLTGAYLEWLVE
jgi:hypothetical protein